MGRLAIYALFWLFSMAVSVRFMHMFQLSSYLFPGYWRWMKSEGAGFNLNYIPFLPRGKAKKPLKFTSRVWRLLVTQALLLAGIAVGTWFIGGKLQIFLLIFSFFCTNILIPLANLLLWPVQKIINNWYIRDAQKRLRPDLTVIGVTGSYGKTSVKTYIGQLLSVKYNILVTPESYNTPMGVVRTIREKLEPSHSVFVCEMGARHVGDIQEVCKIVRPRHGVLTAIGPQHLETFKSVENVAKTKFELIEALPPDGTAFLCWGSEHIREKGSGRPAVRYAVSDDASLDVRAENLTANARGLSFDVITKSGEREGFTCGLLGRHNIENVTAAIAVALHMGVPLRELVPAVRGLKPAKHRLELLPKGGGLTVIDDSYNANPAGTAAALDALGLFPGTKIIITPGMVELGEIEETENRVFGGRIALVCDYAALVGEKQSEPILAGMLDAGFDKEKVKVFGSFNDAYQWAVSIQAEEKTILIENDLPDNYR
ncbi:MAG: UDP-N-acetylmuramoyl-tripeptide--D-alanyl-D-alanine ligase [Oscillospiraceae bacterium]|nr:UDP-N-acetylmuramoyl-tripeptide--D-alanyl-D-alanine ligase [Oscillospiraceae bacterium]